MRSIALFGGTFDPVHNGHIQTSINIQAQFHFTKYYFVPCKIPTLKPANQASSTQRVDMLKLAINAVPHAEIDLREINRDTPSYMVETLQSFRQEYPNDSITLIIGYDSLITLPQWHEWKKLLTLANLLIINRQHDAGAQLPQEIQDLVQLHQNDKQEDLLHFAAGQLMLFDAGNYQISSTQIRALLREGDDAGALLPKAVLDYIKEWGLFR